MGIAAWAAIFGWRPANFWLLMGAGLAALSGFALWVRGEAIWEGGMRGTDLAAGTAAAVVLYAGFAAGRIVTGWVAPGAAVQIGAMYAWRAQAPAWVIVPLLVCVIAPGEELFWRGVVQWDLVQRLGAARGWMLATAVYGGVHLAAGNPMLVLAALGAGGFWGWLYLRSGRLVPAIVSHIVFDLVVFFLLPLR